MSWTPCYMLDNSFKWRVKACFYTTTFVLKYEEESSTHVSRLISSCNSSEELSYSWFAYDLKLAYDGTWAILYYNCVCVCLLSFPATLIQTSLLVVVVQSRARAEGIYSCMELKQLVQCFPPPTSDNMLMLGKLSFGVNKGYIQLCTISVCCNSPLKDISYIINLG